MSDLVLLIRAAGVLLWVIAAANLFVPVKLDYDAKAQVLAITPSTSLSFGGTFT